MHISKILPKILLSSIHKTRIKTLEALLIGLIDCKELKLSSLGRALNNDKERYGIQRVNRFLGNVFFQKESLTVYKCIASFVIGIKHPNILVDWSSLSNSHYLTKGGEHCLLRASLAAEGRAITLYEEVHPKKLESNPKVHANFLKRLSCLLPSDCIPCIITDSGFKTPWFRAVNALGWDYIGRVACGTSCYDDGNGFRSVKELFQLATQTPRFIGSYVLTKSNQLTTNFYLYKGKPKGRHKWTKTLPKKISKDKDTQKHGKAYREPLVLVSSLSGFQNAKNIINRYQSRMSIEENIRDTKSVKTGFSMNENHTIKPERYIVWFVLNALAGLIAWIVGFAAERQKLHFQFQANSYKTRRVLSFFYLGCRIIKRKIILLYELDEIRALAWGASP